MLASGLIAGALGAIVLIGWYVHSILLIQVVATAAPTQRMTALALLLSGIALVLAATGRRRPAAICVLFVLVGAILVCLEYALNTPFGIDELLGRDYVLVHVSHAGRMAPLTALCFLGSSLAFLEVVRRRPRRFAIAAVGILASVLISVGVVGILGYILGRTEMYGWSHFNRVGLITSSGLALIGAGLMAWAWGQSRAREGGPKWLPLSIGLGLAAAALGLWQALMASGGGQFAALSSVILAGGFLGAVLIAIAVGQTQRLHRRTMELQASGMMLEQLFDTSREGLVVLDRHGTIRRVNPQAEMMFGYAHDEIIGVRIENLVPVELRELNRVELTARRKDGSEFPAEIALNHLQTSSRPPVIVVVVRDISEQRRAQEALRLSEERFRHAFEQGPIGVTVLGKDFRMLNANPELCRMFGYSQEELSRMSPLDITHPDDRDPSVNLMSHLFSSDDASIRKLVKRYIRKNGQTMWASLSVSVIRDREGHPVYAISTVEDITERKQAEQTLAKQAALLRMAHDAIFVSDLDNRVTFWNRGAEAMYGWSAEEANGRVAYELLHTRFPSSYKELRSVLQTQGVWEGELEHTTRDGTTLIVATRWSLQRDEKGTPLSCLEINRDITRRRRAEEQLRSLTERLSLATRTASIGIWDLDLRTDLVVWDDTTFAIFGIPKVVPMSREDFARRVHPEDYPAVQASAQRAIEGKTQDSVEFRIIRPDGSVRYISTAEGAVLDDHGNVVRLVGTAVDITERKHMEAQIEASKEQMLASARLSALGMMAGGVAHEINNPLAIIHASASDLLRRVKEEGSLPLAIVVRNGERILQTANRITKIIKSMRHLAREGSRDKARPTRVAKILEETLEVCKERFRDHAVNLLLPTIDPDVSVPCREVQIAQVLLNLLQNAFDAVMEQQEKWVRLEVAVEDDSVIFSVMDSGPGIPPELKSRIMEPFFTTKEVGKGTGLGLSLSRTIVEEHGGSLELREEAGHPCFFFRLPLSHKEELSYAVEGSVHSHR
jgi:PAS domain S-box-containing protein